MARRKSTRGRVLVSAKGRKNTKNIEAKKQQIMNDPTLNDIERRAKIRDLDIYVEQRAKENRQGKNKRLTTTGFEGWEKDNELERMFANHGSSAAEVAEEFGLDEDELLDPDNWQNGIFKGQYKFVHTYTGALLEEI